MSNSPSVGIVILAAGASTRLGTPKQLLSYQGRSFLSHTVEVALSSKCQPIIVVLGAYAEQLRQEVSQFPIQIIENPQWNEGMGASIRVGIQALNTTHEKIDAVVLALCDQPFIYTKIINQLIDAYRLTNKKIVASEYAGIFGVPALFHHTLFSELISLKDDVGAKKIIKKYSHEVLSIPFAAGAIDIDTPNDYKQLKEFLTSSDIKSV